MEIRIRKTGTEINDDDGSDITNTYAVTDNGKEFRINFRTQRHGCNLGIVGQEGLLYSDHETATVHRQVVSIGPACGISIKVDEVVEGLSPWAIRGVTILERSGLTGEIVLTAGGDDSSGKPTILVDGRPMDLGEYM